jgi:hypothetical protein
MIGYDLVLRMMVFAEAKDEIFSCSLDEREKMDRDGKEE